MIRLLVSLIVVIHPVFLFALSDPLIPYGSNLTGHLESSFDTDIYRFEGLKGDRIWIRATRASSAIDASFRLKKGIDILEEVRSSGGDTELFDFVLPDSGIYDIEVYDHNQNDQGGYGLALHKLNDPAYARQITCGDDLLDTIKTEAGIVVYQFDVQAGDRALAQMRSTNAHLESTLYLFNQQGDLLHKSVRKSNTFAFIEKIGVDSTEKYSLFAFDANGNDTGSFGLTYQDLNDPSCASQPLDCRDYRQSVINQVAEIHAFHFDLPAGEGLVAKMMAANPGFEATVHIYDPQASLVFSQTVSGKANDVVVPRVNIAGSYTFLVCDDRANDTSRYNLMFNRLNPDCARELSFCELATDSFDVLSDLNLYYFRMPEDTFDLQVRERDPVIEPYATLIYNGNYISQKDNVQLNLRIGQPLPGSLVFLAVSDNGGNDTGRYRIKTISDEHASGSPPVAMVKENLTFGIPPSGILQLQPEDLDNGSFDDCRIESIKLRPSQFDCSMLGDQVVNFKVTDNDGLSSEVLVNIRITTDLSLEIDNCPNIPVNDYHEELCIPVQATANGGSGEYQFFWSNNNTGVTTEVCPDEVEDFTGKVIDANGCEAEKTVWLPLGANIFCQSEERKITICHFPAGNDNKPEELCISPASLKSHWSHGDYLGPCQGPCNGQTELVIRKSVNPEVAHAALPGFKAHRGETLKINLEDRLADSEHPLQFHLVNTLGQILLKDRIRTESSYLELRLPSGDNTVGLYYLVIQQVGSSGQLSTIPVIIQ
jgi:hypothetical protein